MKRKYKIQQEFVRGYVVYCGYKYFLWIIPLYIKRTTSFSKGECERKIRDYNYCKKPWNFVFWI